MISYQVPSRIETEEELDEILSRPTPETLEAVSKLEGDILILGVGGKIGPTLARLIKRAIEESGVDKRVIGASLFPKPKVREGLNKVGVETVSLDLLEEGAVDKLPEVPNVIYMVGRKSGTEADKSLTWAINTYLPAIVAKKFKGSRIVVFSTGNVYDPIFENEEMETALLSNASRCHSIFGYPRVALGHMIQWVAHWVLMDRPTLNAPMHFEVRDGRF